MPPSSILKVGRFKLNWPPSNPFGIVYCGPEPGVSSEENWEVLPVIGVSVANLVIVGDVITSVIEVSKSISPSEAIASAIPWERLLNCPFCIAPYRKPTLNSPLGEIWIDFPEFSLKYLLYVGLKTLCGVWEIGNGWCSKDRFIKSL